MHKIQPQTKPKQNYYLILNVEKYKMTVKLCISFGFPLKLKFPAQ